MSNKRKEILELKLIRVEKVLKALSNNDLNPEILNETFEFILEHKNKIQSQLKHKNKVTKE